MQLRGTVSLYDALEWIELECPGGDRRWRIAIVDGLAELFYFYDTIAAHLATCEQFQALRAASELSEAQAVARGDW